MEKVQRYEWEDALIQAQTDGVISNGALLVGLKLARAINWCPKDKRPAGLYWKNEDALEAVGCGRSTYFKHRPVLFEQGFFKEVAGNLIPVLPEKSTVETIQSTVETTESTVETKKSTGEHPFTVDIFSEDTLSEDTYKTPASPVEPREEARETGHPSFATTSTDLGYINTDEASVLVVTEEVPQSTVETGEDDSVSQNPVSLFDKYEALRAQRAREREAREASLVDCW